MFDPQDFRRRLIGACTSPRETWAAERARAPALPVIAVGYAAPLVVGTTVLAAMLSFLLGTQDLWVADGGRSFGGMLREMLLGSLLGLVGLALAAAVLWQLAIRFFGGSGGYAEALTLISLAATPALVAAIPGALPWIGWPIQLAAGIWSLVLLYQAIPIFLAVPDGKRPLHFISSLVVVVVLNLVLGLLFGARAGDEHRAREAVSRGSLGGVAAVVELRERAEQDRYSPPASGEVSPAQVERLLKVAEQTAQRRQRYLAELEKATPQGEPEGLAAMARALGGLSAAAGAGARALNAELEAVKADGGNWAEHQWVRERLQAARYEIDASPGTADNRRRYLRDAERIDRALDQLAGG